MSKALPPLIAEGLSLIRPGMREADIRAILGTSKLYDPRKHTGTFSWDGCSLWIEQAVDYIQYGPTFPTGVEVEGLRIGTPLLDAVSRHPTLSIRRSQDRPEASHLVDYAGETSSGKFELHLTVENELVVTIHLARLGYAVDQEERRQLGAARVEIYKREQQLRNRWKTISEPMAMLTDWAENSSPWGEGNARFIAYAKWLMSSSPDEWHDAARSWNWDYGVAPLLWMIRQPDCDQATALAIFYDAQPSFYKPFDKASDEQAVHAEERDLVNEIISRCEANKFTRSEIDFDGASRFLSEFGRQPVTMSEQSVSRSLVGRQIQRGEYYDGIPGHLR